MHKRSPHHLPAVLLDGGAALAVLEAVLATGLAGGGLTELVAVFFVAAVEEGGFLGGIFGIIPKIEMQNYFSKLTAILVRITKLCALK